MYFKLKFTFEHIWYIYHFYNCLAFQYGPTRKPITKISTNMNCGVLAGISYCKLNKYFGEGPTPRGTVLFEN